MDTFTIYKDETKAVPLTDPKNPNNWFTDHRRPVAILDLQETLALIATPGDFLNRREKWEYKSQALCDFMDEMEKDGFVYNLVAVRAFEKAYGLPKHDENGSVISILVYNAQRYRRGDALVADGWMPGSELMAEGAKIVAKGENVFGMEVQEVLTVRKVGERLYAFRPKKRKYAVNIATLPCKLAA